MDCKKLRRLAFALLLSLTPMTGCTTDPWATLRGPGYGVNDVGGGESLRPRSPGDKASGASQRARDIENHLGFE